MKPRRLPRKPIGDGLVYCLYGTVSRDPNEKLCMFFDNVDDMQNFRSHLPGSYRVMTLSGVDYDALTVEEVTS